jgi:hypothetical protein
MAVLASSVVRQPSPCDHLIQSYTDDGFLGDVVADYVEAGFIQGEGAVIIATDPHVALFANRLAARGVHVPSAVAGHRLLFLNAEQTLAKFIVAGQPDRERFLSVVGSALDHVRAGGLRGVRLYGEMVDLLWGVSLDATMTLERLWNEVLTDERLSLLCAYRLDALDRRAQGVLRQVTHCHSHLLPMDDPERFERAVDRAYTEVFGVRGDARTLRELMIAREGLKTVMAKAQAAVFALEALPSLIANEVRARARRYYRAPA